MVVDADGDVDPFADIRQQLDDLETELDADERAYDDTEVEPIATWKIVAIIVACLPILPIALGALLCCLAFMTTRGRGGF